MKRILTLSLALALASWPVLALANGQPVNAAARTSGKVTAVQLTTTAASVGGLADRKNITLQNLGPNPVYCGFTDTVTATTGFQVAANGGVWSQDYGTAVKVYCLAETADQISPKDTRVVESN